jgi:hypothetical protein
MPLKMAQGPKIVGQSNNLLVKRNELMKNATVLMASAEICN